MSNKANTKGKKKDSRHADKSKCGRHRDVSDTMFAVAVPKGRDKEHIKEFGAFTRDLLAISQWLRYCNIETVAMWQSHAFGRKHGSLLESIICCSYQRRF
jgi:hypothetical protein